MEKVGKDKVDIQMKDYRITRFQCTKADQPQVIIDTIHSRCYPISDGISQLQTFAFRYTEMIEAKSEGWKVFDTIQDFKRMGIPNQRWRISKMNENYAKSSTYPRYICVPAKITDSQLDEVFEFRSKGRIPAISFLHKFFSLFLLFKLLLLLFLLLLIIVLILTIILLKLIFL